MLSKLNQWKNPDSFDNNFSRACLDVMFTSEKKVQCGPLLRVLMASTEDASISQSSSVLTCLLMLVCQLLFVFTLLSRAVILLEVVVLTVSCAFLLSSTFLSRVLMFACRVLLTLSWSFLFFFTSLSRSATFFSKSLLMRACSSLLAWISFQILAISSALWALMATISFSRSLLLRYNQAILMSLSWRYQSSLLMDWIPRSFQEVPALLRPMLIALSPLNLMVPFQMVMSQMFLRIQRWTAEKSPMAAKQSFPSMYLASTLWISTSFVRVSLTRILRHSLAGSILRDTAWRLLFTVRLRGASSPSSLIFGVFNDYWLRYRKEEIYSVILGIMRHPRYHNKSPAKSPHFITALLLGWRFDEHASA